MKKYIFTILSILVFNWTAFAAEVGQEVANVPAVDVLQLTEVIIDPLPLGHDAKAAFCLPDQNLIECNQEGGRFQLEKPITPHFQRALYCEGHPWFNPLVRSSNVWQELPNGEIFGVIKASDIKTGRGEDKNQLSVTGMLFFPSYYPPYYPQLAMCPDTPLAKDVTKTLRITVKEHENHGYRIYSSRVDR